MNVDLQRWARELEAHRALFEQLGQKQPPALEAKRTELEAKLAH
jgi:GTP-dependent phosphoenolpyruvate carboxykinase